MRSTTPITSRARVGATTAALLLSGCTQLSVVHLNPRSEIPLAGAPYNLTFTQYEITVVRRLTSCEGPEITVDVTMTANEVRDPQREYVIDFTSLRSFFKTTNVTVDYYDNGAIKAINATAKDQTAPIIASVFTSIGKIATGIAAGGVTPFAAMAKVPRAHPPANKCSPKIAEAVKNADINNENSLAVQVRDKTAELASVTTDLERLTSMAAAMGHAWGRRERAEMADKIKTLYATKKSLAELNETLKTTLDLITVTDTVIWPPDGETLAQKEPLIPSLDNDQLEQWGIFDKISESARNKLLDGTAVWMKIVPTSPFHRTATCLNTSCGEDAVAGLKYRMQAPGEMLACSTEDCEPDNILARDARLISQLGPVFTLPLKNYPFMTQTLNATFNQAGQPTQLGFMSEAAALEAANTFGVLADEVIKVRDATKPKSELETLKEQTELLKAKAELEVAKKALETPKNAEQTAKTEALKADTAVLEAELAKMNAEAALATAKATAGKL